ncbi:MAG: pirin family protein, partial [Acidimicrobiaceae bacterium]|nr:pirin family protein [Acidimicrobiaceae bacterium]
HIAKDSDGRLTEITIIAGALEGHEAPAPPPNSWAARAEADVAVWHIRMDAGAEWTMPAAHGDDTRRVIYAFDGSSVEIGDQTIDAGTGALTDASVDVALRAGLDGVELMVLQGCPIGEPVAQYGPFVMNTDDEIQQTMADYQRTRFGGWPWPTPTPDHGRDAGRFAIHADGRREDRH